MSPADSRIAATDSTPIATPRHRQPPLLPDALDSGPLGGTRAPLRTLAATGTLHDFNHRATSIVP